MNEIFLSVEQLDAGLTSLRGLEVFKRAIHTDDGGRYEILDVEGCCFSVVQISLYLFRDFNWVSTKWNYKYLPKRLRSHTTIFIVCMKARGQIGTCGLNFKIWSRMKFMTIIIFTAIYKRRWGNLNGDVNMHNCHMWGLKQPHEIHSHMPDSPDVNVCCVIMHDHFVKPSLFLLPLLFMEHDYGKHLPAYVMKVCVSTNLLNSNRRWNFVSTRRDPPQYSMRY